VNIFIDLMSNKIEDISMDIQSHKTIVNHKKKDCLM